MDGDLHFALSRFVLDHHRELVVVLDDRGRVVDANKSARAGELDLASLFDVPARDVRIDAFFEELELSGIAHTLVASANGSVYRLEGTTVGKYRVVVARELAKNDDARPPLGPVAASFVHDFNNLLVPILLLSGRLARDLERESESAMIAADIHSSATLAAALARDVLALARPRRPAVQRVDVNGMLLDIERLTRRLAGANVDILYALGDDAALETRVDRGRLEHAVLSLVVAARESMPDGGHLAIATALVDQGSTRAIALSLTDTGDTDATTRDVRARAAEGFVVDVRSADGHGTCVTVLLDRATDRAADAPPPSAVTSRAARVVMIAERDERVRRAVTRVLESHGWKVVAVESQDDAIATVAAHPVGVAMLDSSVLRREPATFLHRLKALAPALRLVLLSDHALGDSVPVNVVVLQKPFGDGDLVGAITRALG